MGEGDKCAASLSLASTAAWCSQRCKCQIDPFHHIGVGAAVSGTRLLERIESTCARHEDELVSMGDSDGENRV